MSGTDSCEAGFVDKLLYIEIPFDPPGDPRDPFPEYARRRVTMPVEVDTARFGPDSPLVFLYRHADIVEALKNHQMFSSAALGNMMAPTMGDRVLLGMEEPEHGRYRALVSPALRPRLLARWEHSLIHRVADELIDRIASRGHAELVHDFNFQFPARVVAQVIGLPPENYHQFQTWAIDIVGVAGDPMPGIAASKAFRDYLKPFIEARRAQAQDDMISELVRAEIDGEKLEPEEIMSCCSCRPASKPLIARWAACCSIC